MNYSFIAHEAQKWKLLKHMYEKRQTRSFDFLIFLSPTPAEIIETKYIFTNNVLYMYYQYIIITSVIQSSTQ